MSKHSSWLWWDTWFACRLPTHTWWEAWATLEHRRKVPTKDYSPPPKQEWGRVVLQCLDSLGIIREAETEFWPLPKGKDLLQLQVFQPRGPGLEGTCLGSTAQLSMAWEPKSPEKKSTEMWPSRSNLWAFDLSPVSCPPKSLFRNTVLLVRTYFHMPLSFNGPWPSFRKKPILFSEWISTKKRKL